MSNVKGKAPSKHHTWDAKNKRWRLKTFEERQKGRNILLQGKNNPIRIVHDTIRNVNAAKELRNPNKSKIKKNTNKKSSNNNLTDKDREDIRKENETAKLLTSSGKYKEVDAPGKNNKGKKVLQRVDKPKKETEKRKNRPKQGSAGARIQADLRSKGFSQDELDRLSDKHADFKKHRKAGTLKEFAKKYPNSQTAKRLRKNETPGQRKKRLKKNTETPKNTEKKSTKVKIKPSQLPPDKVKMADGRIVDRADLYKNKK